MIIVKTHGKYIKELTCPECECDFLYNDSPRNKDTQYPSLSLYDEDCCEVQMKKYISCPECGHIIWLDK